MTTHAQLKQLDGGTMTNQKVHSYDFSAQHCSRTAARTSRNAGDVTCRRCVFQMLAIGEIGADDARVTDAMRERIARTVTS